jgi:hypothetical protein
LWDETDVIAVTDRAYGVTLAAGPASPWAEGTLAAALKEAVLSLTGDEDLAALSGAERFADFTEEDVASLHASDRS